MSDENTSLARAIEPRTESIAARADMSEEDVRLYIPVQNGVVKK